MMFPCVEKMSPHRPTTQQSSKNPKGKNIQTSEALSLVIVEESEHVPKVEPVIGMPQNKYFT
jgi:hypothetical protein